MINFFMYIIEFNEFLKITTYDMIHRSVFEVY